MAKPSSKAAARPRAMSLHIGLNLADPKHDGGWSGPLAAREQDAKDMAAIAKAQGMAVSRRLTEAGARRAVPAESGLLAYAQHQAFHDKLLGSAAAFVAQAPFKV